MTSAQGCEPQHDSWGESAWDEVPQYWDSTDCSAHAYCWQTGYRDVPELAARTTLKMPAETMPSGTEGLVAPWRPSPLCSDTSVLKKLPESVMPFLRSQTSLSTSVPWTLRIYVDGTGGTEHGPAAWGMACFLVDIHHNHLLLGCIGGRVQLDPDQPDYIGATKATVGTAELSARVWASMWALTNNAREVEVGFDSSYAATSTTALRPNNANDVLAKVSSALWQLLGIRTNVTEFHIKSHMLHPGNELADSVACTASLNGAVGRISANPLQTFVSENGGSLASCQWAFLDFIDARARAQYPESGEPPVHPSRVMEWSKLGHLDLEIQSPSPCQEYTEYHELWVCSFNALSLKAQKSRRQLALQLTRRNCFLAGIQEGRRKEGGIFRHDGYIQIVSAAYDGNYGTEIWISEKIPYATSSKKKLRLLPQHISVEHSDPRRLIVRIAAPKLHARIASFHAPHSRDPVLAEWWEETGKIAARGPDIDITLIDANETLTENGRRHFRSWCERIDAIIPADMHELLAPNADQTTFLNSEGNSWSQIDFVVCARTMHITVGTVQAWKDVDVGHRRTDHVPTALMLSFPPDVSPPEYPARCAEYNRDRVHDLHAQSVFAAILEQAPPVPFAIEPSTHCHVLEEYIRQAALEAFGPPIRQPKQPYVTASTLECIQTKSRKMRRCNAAGRRLQTAATYCTFRAWAVLIGMWRPTRAFSMTTGWNSMEQLRGRQRLRKEAAEAKQQVNSLVTLEILAAADAATDLAEAAMANGSSGQLFAAIRKFQPRRARPLIRICGSDGRPALSAIDEQEIFRDHFAKVFDGERRSHAWHAKVVVLDERPIDLVKAVGDADPRAIPTLIETASLFRVAAHRKAVGMDKIGGELFRAAPTQLAAMWHPLFLKTTLTLSPPIQFRGGVLVALLKAGVTGKSCEHFRDIGLATVAGKAFAKFYRPRLMKRCKHQIPVGQFGAGCNGGGCDLAGLGLRLFLEAYSQSKMTAAVLFLDIKAAFASMQRRLAFSDADADEALVKAMVDAGIPMPMVLQCWEDLCALAQDVDSPAAPHDMAVIAQLHRHTWTSSDGLPGILTSMRGVLAGLSLSDLVFAVVTGRLAQRLAAKVALAGLIPDLPRPPANSPFLAMCGPPDSDWPTMLHLYYVDDGALPIVSHAADVVRDLAMLTSIAVHTYAEFGFILRAGPHKTAALIQWRGRGSNNCQADIQSHGNIIDVHVLDQAMQLPVVASYKHLGAIVTANGIGPELGARCGAITSDLRRLRCRVLYASGVPLERRAMAAKAIILCRGCYMIGVWPRLTMTQARRFHGKVMEALKATLGPWEDRQRFTDSVVLKEMKAAAPLVMIRLARLALLIRMISRAPTFLAVLAASASGVDGSWARQVADDGRWFAALENAPTLIADFGSDKYWASVKARPGAMRDAYVKLAAGQQAREDWPTTAAEREISHTYECNLCQKIFATKAKLAVHMFGQHSVRRPVVSKILSSVCTVCLVDFQTRRRMIAHVSERSPICELYYLACEDVGVEELEAANLRDLEEARILKASGRRDVYCQNRCVRVPGPLVAPLVGQKLIGKKLHPATRAVTLSA